MVLMLGGSGGLLLFLQRLLTEIDLLSLLSEAIADLIRGLQQLAEALVGFGSLVLIASLVVLIAVLLLGGSLRALRLVRLALGRDPSRDGVRAGVDWGQDRADNSTIRPARSVGHRCCPDG